MFGAKVANADKSVAWNEKYPNFSDADIIIVNLSSLTEETLNAIDQDEYATASQVIVDRFIHGGTVVYIYPRDEFSTENGELTIFDSCPILFEIVPVQEGYAIVIDKNNPFAKYLSNFKKFNSYINGPIIPEYIENRLHSIYGWDKYRLKQIDCNFARDKANHVLAGAYTFQSEYNKANFVCGKLVFLPPPTEITIDQGIRIIVDILQETDSVGDSLPNWITGVPLSGLAEIDADLDSLLQKRKKMEEEIAKVTATRNEQLKVYRLLASNGPPLEEQVHYAFRLLGFTDIRREREDDKEDGIITFQTKSLNYEIAVIEVKGVENGMELKHLRQCSHWAEDYLETGRKAKPVIVINQFRKSPYPQSRPERQHVEDNQLDYAEKRDICIIPSFVLFEAVNNTIMGKKKDRGIIEYAISKTRGVLSDL